jgi:hypothetical protein
MSVEILSDEVFSWLIRLSFFLAAAENVSTVVHDSFLVKSEGW